MNVAADLTIGRPECDGVNGVVDEERDPRAIAASKSNRGEAPIGVRAGTAPAIDRELNRRLDADQAARFRTGPGCVRAVAEAGQQLFLVCRIVFPAFTQTHRAGSGVSVRRGQHHPRFLQTQSSTYALPKRSD